MLPFDANEQTKIGDVLFSWVQFFLRFGPILFGLVGFLFRLFLPFFVFDFV
jgi:hypothetical protein